MTAPAEPAFAAHRRGAVRDRPDAYFDVSDSCFMTTTPCCRQVRCGNWLLTGARAGGLDEAAVTACLGDDAGLQRVQARWSQAGADGVRGTPTFFVNGRRFEGHTFAEFDTEFRRLIPNYRSPAEEMFDHLRPGG